MEVSGAPRQKALEDQNRCLKTLPAELMLDVSKLRESLGELLTPRARRERVRSV